MDGPGVEEDESQRRQPGNRPPFGDWPRSARRRPARKALGNFQHAGRSAGVAPRKCGTRNAECGIGQAAIFLFRTPNSAFETKKPWSAVFVCSPGPYKTFGELRRMESLGEWRSLACYCTSRL